MGHNHIGRVRVFILHFLHYIIHSCLYTGGGGEASGDGSAGFLFGTSLPYEVSDRVTLDLQRAELLHSARVSLDSRTDS